jgi:hypothetical protein
MHAAYVYPSWLPGSQVAFTNHAVTMLCGAVADVARRVPGGASSRYVRAIDDVARGAPMVALPHAPDMRGMLEWRSSASGSTSGSGNGNSGAGGPQVVVGRETVGGCQAPCYADVMGSPGFQHGEQVTFAMVGKEDAR